MRSALPLAALTLAAAVLLAGCVPQDPEVIPPPEQTSEPVFASDEEALAAATDAYTAYLATSDLIAQEGGANPERIAPLVTEEWLEKELNGFNALSSSTRHQVGASAFGDVSLQRVEESPGYRAVTVYVCHNATDVQILDASGMDVTPASLGSPWTAEVTFEIESTADQLLLAGNDPWVRNEGC